MAERSASRVYASDTFTYQNILSQSQAVRPGYVSATDLAACPTRAVMYLAGHEFDSETSQKATRRNNNSLLNRGAHAEYISARVNYNPSEIFRDNIELSLKLSPNCTLTGNVDYIRIEEDQTLHPVVLRPTTTREWGNIANRGSIAAEDKIYLQIICRLLEKTGVVKEGQISWAEVIYLNLIGNQYTTANRVPFGIIWDNTTREEIVDHVNNWHNRFLDDDIQPFSKDDHCRDLCPFGKVCLKPQLGNHHHQLDLKSARHPLLLEDAPTPVPNIEEKYILGSVDSDLGNCPDCYQPIQVTHWIDRDNGGDSVTLARELRCGCECIGEVKKLTVARSQILEVIS